jgi:acetyltransferase
MREILTLGDGRAVLLRPARPGDAPAVQEFVRGLSIASRRRRFFSPVRELSPEQLDRLTRVRDARELALVAVTSETGAGRVIALAQTALCEPPTAEFALVVDDAYQRRGLGRRMLGALAEHAARAGLAALTGFVLADNWPMLTLLATLGFELADDRDPQLVHVARALAAQEFAT